MGDIDLCVDMVNTVRLRKLQQERERLVMEHMRRENEKAYAIARVKHMMNTAGAYVLAFALTSAALITMGLAMYGFYRVVWG